MARESNFEHALVRRILRIYPGAIILKNDANRLQGFPDRLILFGKAWAAFDTKAKETAGHRPNQDYYIDLLNQMSYASFVYPQNEETFLHELQQTLRPNRRTRLSKRE